MFYPNIHPNSYMSPAMFLGYSNYFLNTFPCIMMNQQLHQSSQFDEYQKHYCKIYDLVKSQYKKQISSTLSLEEVSSCSFYLYENMSHGQESSETFLKDKTNEKSLCY